MIPDINKIKRDGIFAQRALEIAALIKSLPFLEESSVDELLSNAKELWRKAGEIISKAS